MAGAMLALAAGVALYIGVHKNLAEPVVATSHESAQPAAPASPGPEAPAAAASVAATKPQTLRLDDLKPTEIENLAEEPGKVAVPSATSPMTLALKGREERSAPAALRAPASAKKNAAQTGNAAPAEPQQQALALKETDEAAPSTDISAEKGSAPADKQAALPSRPSVGAIQGAVGSVMGGARSCLAGQEGGSKATVTFGADGHVKSVSVTGPAAGTPAEGCVRSALMGARVPPFSEPEYSASFTVRPP
jgi:hypothetical protein